jgi:tRNA pseudouridine55 synthase
VHGWLIIDKPVGPGSTAIVGAVKRALREGGYPKVKVGHGGTLDPLASGVLPIALGEATKLSGHMLGADKAYEFTIGFGVETDTLDGEGVAVATSDKRPTCAEIEAVLPAFTGAIDQVPPVYSAMKVDGKAAYARTRAGEEVVLKSRTVTIHQLSIRHSSESWNPTSPSSAGPEEQGDSSFRWNDGLSEITLEAKVSKGTYIRSLARDVSRALGTVGHVTMLRRTRAGPFTLEQAISLDKLGEHAKGRTLEQALLPLTAGLDDIPALPVTPDQAGALRQGRLVIGISAQPGLHLATDASVPVALVELSEGNLRVVRGFNL